MSRWKRIEWKIGETRSTLVAYFVRLLVLNSQICFGNQSACFQVRPGSIVFTLTIKWIGYKSLAVNEWTLQKNSRASNGWKLLNVKMEWNINLSSLCFIFFSSFRTFSPALNRVIYGILKIVSGEYIPNSKNFDIVMIFRILLLISDIHIEYDFIIIII